MRTSTPHLIFTLVVLTAINTMNFFDRQILPAVQEKIRREWDLSDSQLGTLGTAFILLYAIVGVPLGRLADVGRRKWLLAGGVFLWSLMTLGSGLAWGFWSLLVMRLGVGIGEATCAPTASSLIGDLVPAERRARAMAVFMLGLPVGLALSFLVSSTIAQYGNWQAAFFVAGVPGLLLAGLALLIADKRAEDRGQKTEDRRKGTEESKQTTAGFSTGLRSLYSVTREIVRLPTMQWLILSGALHNFNMYALGTFLASFLKRYHGVSIERAGQISALVYGCGALGIFAAGWLGDRAFRRGVGGRLHVAWIGLMSSIPCLLLALRAPAGDWWVCAAWLLPSCTLLYAYYGTVYASIQDIIEPKLRGTAMAIYFCGMYLLGAVLGPVATGWLSDNLARRAAIDTPDTAVLDVHKAIGLHDAMYAIPVLNVLLVLVLIKAAWAIKDDYEQRSKA